jgi:hypothetical protein
MPSEPSESIDLIQVKVAIKEGSIAKIDDVFEAVAPQPVSALVGKVPVPVEVSDDEKAALERLPEVIGSVVPSERRVLTDDEPDRLLDEREVLKVIEGLVKRRLADISLTVLNHSTVEVEQGATDGLMVGADGKPLLNKEGQAIRKVKVLPESAALRSCFSVETRAGTPVFDLAQFHKDCEDPEVTDLTHKDYLNNTTAVRVFDENKAMANLRRDPDLLLVMSRYVKAPVPTVAVYQREVK